MGSSQSDAGGGFRIFRINPNSPAERAGLEMFFDYIVEIDDVQLVGSSNEQQQIFFKKIQAAVDRQVRMVVFNVRSRSFRDVWVVPCRWGGTGLLGATVRYDSFESAQSQGVRVLEVFPDSPAFHAGLVPFKDYLLGTSESVFKDLDELIDTVHAYVNREVVIYVYNSDSEQIREVGLTPNYNWGGQGCLGCDIGTGYLHRVPEARKAALTKVGREGSAARQGFASSPATVPQQSVTRQPHPITVAPGTNNGYLTTSMTPGHTFAPAGGQLPAGYVSCGVPSSVPSLGYPKESGLKGAHLIAPPPQSTCGPVKASPAPSVLSPFQFSETQVLTASTSQSESTAPSPNVNLVSVSTYGPDGEVRLNGATDDANLQNAARESHLKGYRYTRQAQQPVYGFSQPGSQMQRVTSSTTPEHHPRYPVYPFNANPGPLPSQQPLNFRPVSDQMPRPGVIYPTAGV